MLLTGLDESGKAPLELRDPVPGGHGQGRDRRRCFALSAFLQEPLHESAFRYHQPSGYELPICRFDEPGSVILPARREKPFCVAGDRVESIRLFQDTEKLLMQDIGVARASIWDRTRPLSAGYAVMRAAMYCSSSTESRCPLYPPELL